MSKALRTRAEAFLDANPETTPTVSTSEVQKLLHELQVHQVELEMQNEELREAQVELARSRDTYAELYDFAPVGYLTIDREGVIQEANHTAATMLGGERVRLVGRKFSDFVQRGAQEAWFLHRRAGQASNDKQNAELPLHKADGTAFTARLESSPRPGGSAEDWRCMMALVDVTERELAREVLQHLNQALDERVRERTADLRRLAAELAVAEEQERRRIAGEVHDELGQILAMCSNELHRIGLTCMPDEGDPSAKRLQELLDKAIADTRKLTYELSSPLLHTLGLAAALEHLCTDLGKRHGLDVVFRGDAEGTDLGEGNRIVLFRCVRELLINVAKHARASEACCSLSRHGHFVRAEVSDNGIGFDSGTIGRGFSTEGGFGLFNVRECVRHVGGRLELDSAPGNGARIVLEVPAEKQGGSCGAGPAGRSRAGFET